MPHASSATAAPAVDFGRMGEAAVQFLLQLLVLLVMTIVASLITARGVHLYHVASAPPGRSNTSDDGSTPSLSMSEAGPGDPPASPKIAGRQ
jgi:hypothetical protein